MLPLPPVEDVRGLDEYPVLYWNHAGLEMNRISHSLGGPHTGPTMSSRALGLLHLAMHDAYFGAAGNDQNTNPNPTYLTGASLDDCGREAGWAHDQGNEALTAAAITVLDTLYKRGGAGISILANDVLTSSLSQLIAEYTPYIDTLGKPFGFGACVAKQIINFLAVKADEPGADQGRYEPKRDRFHFRDEPVNPVKRVPIDPDRPERGTKAQRTYHAPFDGETVRTFAVHDEAALTLAPPPKDATTQEVDRYRAALREVRRVGGAPLLPTTRRTPDQTVAALFWAYDGANLIGTPPRLYNQIIRSLALDNIDPAASEELQTAEFVRLLALINVAMADAGKFSWKEKYKYEFWRPLSGVREHDAATGAGATGASEHLDEDADPFWLALGAPETNTNKISFKPPFPAYPSGHATFGAACFQMARLFYKNTRADLGLSFDDNAADNIGFSFVSEELNGVSRDLHDPYDPNLPIIDQPGMVRTRVVRNFKSLWQAIFENAVSRVYLGVHWHFDAFNPDDTVSTINGDGTISYKDTDQVKYDGNTGGVWLGIGIANDIWSNGMKPPEAPPQAAAAVIGRELTPKSSNTNIR